MAIFAVALVIRLIHLVTIRGSPFFNHLYIDPGFYDEWGLRIAAGHLLSERPFFLDPLYPYFIGAVYALFGHSYFALGLIQALLGALVPLLLYLAARRWYDAPVPALAGWIAVFYLPAIYFGGIVMKPGLSLFLITLALWLLSWALSGGGQRVWVATGVALGLTILTRGNLLLVLPCIALWVLLRAPLDRTAEVEGVVAELRRRLSLRSRRWQAAGLLLGAVAVLALPAAHNLYVGGQFILTTANAGQNFYIGNNPTNQTGEYQQLPFVNPSPKYEQRDFEREAERRTGTDLSDSEISRYWFAESGSWIRSDPAGWVKLMWSKVRAFWGAYEIPDSLDYYLYADYAPLLRLPLPGFGLLAPLALLGGLLSLSRRGWPRLLVLFTVVYTATVILFFVFSRFRMVVAPALYVFAAYAVVRLVQLWSEAFARRRFGAPLVTTALLLFFLAFVNLPVRAVAHSRGFRLARSVGLPVVEETTSNGRFNIAVVYAAVAKQADDPQDWLRRAEEELILSIELDPLDKKGFLELAKVLARQERNDEAIEAYRGAASLDPRDYRIYHGSGLLLRRGGRLREAEDAFRKAMYLRPRYAPSAIQLGQVLLELGRNDEAALAFTHALSLRPGDPAAQAGLRAAEGR